MNPHFNGRNEVTGNRDELMLAMFDMSESAKRLWYDLTPERDLIHRFEVTQCPTLIYAPRTCNGATKWCVKQIISEHVVEVGCEDFQSSCPNFESLVLNESKC